MPLAKNSQDAPETDITAHPQAVEVFTVSGVPYDVFSFFNVSLDDISPKNQDKLKDIYEYFKADKKTLGDTMQDISNLESRLGLGGYGSRVDRVWNWVSLGRKIKDLELRKQSLERR